MVLLAQPLDHACLTVITYSAARVGEINRLIWDDVSWATDANDKAAGACHGACQPGTKNSPWVFTNPKMTDKYPGESNRWRCIYRDKCFHTR
jgi:hypothetical protein